jgi:hypothetical protein
MLPSPGRRGSKTRSTPPRKTRTKKISITVDEGVLQEAARAAKKARRTLSAQITEDLAEAARRRHLSAFIADYEREHGTITTEELAQARKRWPT